MRLKEDAGVNAAGVVNSNSATYALAFSTVAMLKKVCNRQRRHNTAHVETSLVEYTM